MAETNSSVPRFFVCPYCGGVHKDQLPGICNYCHGPLDPDSREQTKADLGPWFVRDTNRSFAPGMRYETLLRRIKQKRLCATDVVRDLLWMISLQQVLVQCFSVIGRCYSTCSCNH